MTPTTTDPLVAELRSLTAAVQDLVEVLRASAAPRALPDPAVRSFLQAVFECWGANPFLTGELLQWAGDRSFTHRSRVIDAARALLALPAGAAVTAHLLGLRLHQIAGTQADGLTLERSARERGSRLWVVCRVRN